VHAQFEAESAREVAGDEADDAEIQLPNTHAEREVSAEPHAFTKRTAHLRV
jgi:hypothetical protein